MTTADPADRKSRRGLATIAFLFVVVVSMIVGAVVLTGCSVSTTKSSSASTGGGSLATASTTKTSTTGSSSSGSLGDASPAKPVADKLGPSVVNIAVTGSSSSGAFGQQQTYQAEGSGVIYTSDGYIITNNHVVVDDNGDPVTSIMVTLATGEQLKATLVGRDSQTEIAVIKVNSSKALPAAEFESAYPAVGDYAIAIGSPFGYENSVTMGIVSGLNRTIDGTSGAEAAALSNLIQTDAPINSGNSGGALANAEAKVIGINVAKLSSQSGAENLGFAIPSVVATKIADEIIKTGKVTHAYLGVATQTVNSSFAQDFGLSSNGVMVAEVSSGSPAAKAGIKQGDYILKIDDKTISSSSDILIAIRDKKPGDTVKVTIKRNNQERVLSVTLQERTAALQ